MTEQQLERRYVFLSALQLFAVAMALPVQIIIMQARGLSAAEIGLVVAIGAITIAVLELPFGGIADVMSKRAILVLASGSMGVSFAIMAIGQDFSVFLLGGVFFAVARALESGPLQSWYVERLRSLVATPQARDAAITRGVGRAAAAQAFSASVGALAGGGLAALGTVFGMPATGTALLLSLSLPIMLALLLQFTYAGCVMGLVQEVPRSHARASALYTELGPTMSSVGKMLHRDGVIRFFSYRWLLVAAGFQAFEFVSPVRIVEITNDPANAALTFSALIVLTQLATAATAATAPTIQRKFGAIAGSMSLTVLAGLGFIFAAAQSGIVGLAVCLVLAYAVMGPVNGLQAPLLHSRVPDTRRVTLLSLESLSANVSIFFGTLVLGYIATRWGADVALASAGAMTVCAAVPMLGVRKYIGGPPTITA